MWMRLDVDVEVWMLLRLDVWGAHECVDVDGWMDEGMGMGGVWKGNKG